MISASLTSLVTPTKRQLSALAFLIIFVAGGCSIQSSFIGSINNKILDAQFALSRHFFPQAIEKDVVIVGIDENFLNSVDEPLALNHIHLANFLRVTSQAGAQVIGLDLELPEKRFDSLISTHNPELDFHKTLLSGLLQTIPNTVVIAGKIWDQEHTQFRNIQVDYSAVLSMQGERQQSLASVYFCRDGDQRIRRYPGGCQPDHSNLNFASEISAAAGVRKNWSGLINYRLGGLYTYLPIQDLLTLSEQGKSEELKRLFGGKIVLLGAVLDSMDLLDLPVRLASWIPADKPVPGVLAHAQLIRSMLNQGMVQPVSFLLLLPICLLFALFWFGQSIVFKATLFLTSVIFILAACGILLQADIWLAPGAIIFTGLMALVGSGVLQAWQHFIDKQRLSRAFSGRVSPSIMKEIVEGRLDTTRQSRRLPVCVLFSDIRGFTTLCEHLQAEEVVDLLNRYFGVMVSEIHRHGGTVDKFMGDGLMAFFGAPNALACPEKNAFNAAQAMLVALTRLNLELAAEGRAPLMIGVGLHSGDAIIGQVGSSERHEYTAIGDTVNTAARLEGLCKDVGYPIVCSDVVANAIELDSGLIALGEKPLKGRSAIAVFGWQQQQTV